MMAYAKIARIFTVWLMVSTCMHIQAWWFTDWLLNKPLAPQIKTDRAGNDLLTTAACLTGVTLFSGFACYKWYSAKKQVDSYKKNTEEKEQKIVKLTTENNELGRQAVHKEQTLVKLTTENNELGRQTAHLEARYATVETTMKSAQLLTEQLNAHQVWLTQAAIELVAKEAQVNSTLAQLQAGCEIRPEESGKEGPSKRFVEGMPAPRTAFTRK